jgi:DNA-binding NtrC family response regulator
VAPKFDLPRSLIGNSTGMRAIIQRIHRMADHRWPVLILGETGTGKELIARLIHHESIGGPFVVIDCSTIPSHLMESELFGYVRGAFTGAVQSKTGLIEAADGGTAFFDEVGELPLDVQAKLLRVLQEKEFRPVGATQSRRSDFRVIAATHRDLAAAADRGTFRRDLYYRLKVVTLRLPPLRERRDDIPDLVRFFIQKHGGACSVSPEVMHALAAHEWSGNVRELENCVQAMVAGSRGPVLDVLDIPSTVISQVHTARSPLLGLAAATGQSIAPAADPVFGDSGGPIVPLAELERREILRAIEFTRGDRTTAAALLRIGRTTLYRKLKEYGIDS